MELPYTLPQDSTMYLILKKKNNDIWKNKAKWLIEKNAPILFITHPDYMNFKNEYSNDKQYPINLYTEFLEWIKANYENQYWNPLPHEFADYCKENLGK